MQSKKIKIGELDVTVVQGTNTPSVAAILCHGFGASGDDLVGIAEEMVAMDSNFKDIAFLFPEAPITLEDEDDSRAWWRIDIAKIQQLADDEKFEDLKSDCPDAIVDCGRMLQAVIQHVHQTMRLEFSKIVVGGFSQGAMLATDVALQFKSELGGLIIWSGNLICESKWQSAAGDIKFPVFQSHGTMDPVLPFDNAVDLCNLLVDAGLDVSFNEFDGPHTIAESGFKGAMKLLRKTLKN